MVWERGGAGAGSVATAEAEDEVERRLLLDVVVRQGSSALEVLPREGETCLIRVDVLLVLGFL